MRALRRTEWALAAIVAAAALLRLWRLGTEGLSVDEAYTWSVAREPVWQVLANHDNTPPLYNLIEHFWIQVAGTSEWALRFPAALFGILAVAMTFPVARRIVGEPGAIAATALHAGSFYVWQVSQEARTYSLYLLLTLVSFHFFLKLAESWTRRNAVLYVLASVGMLYGHVFGFLPLAVQWLHVVAFRTPAPATSRRWLVVQGAVVLGFLPWLPVLFGQAEAVGRDFWLAHSSLGGLLGTAVWFSGSKWLAAAFAVLLGLAAAWTRPWQRPAPADKPRWRLHVLAWSWLVLPVAVVFVAGLVFRVYRPKYLLASALPLMMLAGLALVRIRPRGAQAGAAVAVAVLVGATFVGYGAGWEPDLHPADWRTAVHDLDARASRGELVVFNGGVCDASGTDRLCPYYYYANRRDLRFVPFLPGIQDVTPENVGKLDAVVANETRLWLVQGFFSDHEELIAHRLAANFTLVHDSQTPVRLREYVRAGK